MKGTYQSDNDFLLSAVQRGDQKAFDTLPLKRTHLRFWTIPVCRVFPQKNRKQPAGIIREMPRTLAPMALRPCLSTSLQKNCPIFLKIDTLFLSTIL